MIKSIRYFLLISLLLSITVASAINGIGNYLLDAQVIQPYLDTQLLRTALLVDVFNQLTYTNPKAKNAAIDQLLKTPIAKQKFVFQIWDLKGNLLMTTPYFKNIPLKEAPFGFSDKEIGGKQWRVYTVLDQKQEVKIIIAELYNLRRELADDIARSNANILLVIYPIFGVLVWLIISIAFRSISRVTNEISSRASTFLEPVQLTEVPNEIKPLIEGLNQLFIRLKLAFERNKRFAADAAHELRTPLAALKTHAQVALKANNELDSSKALQKVIESVDRSSHVVTQLLTLSRLSEEEELTDVKPVDLHKLAVEIIAYLVPQAFSKHIDIELALPPMDPIVLGNDTALGILIRNLVDNAIRYTPPQGEVNIAILNNEKQVILRVADTGPGIPPDLRERVFERFYRILGTKASGSGLGLAIVNQIATLHHAHIHLTTPANKVGLQVDVAFPRYHA